MDYTLSCNNPGCAVELTGRQRTYCSDKCRKQDERHNKPPEGRPQGSNSDTDILHNSDKSNSDTVTRTRVGGCRVAIPGDEDYTGCVVDGMVVKSEPIPVKDMTRIQLDQAIRAYPHDQWINSPEHKELMRRLNTMTIDQLEAEGYHVPAWKVAI